jgi:anaerobic selenocysteine-containing dehydrogenase
MYHQCRKVRADLPESFQEAFKTGLFKWKREGEPLVGLRPFRENPDGNPLNTPSGKIEVFSKSLWDLARSWELPEGDVISALPEYHPTWGMPPNTRSDKQSDEQSREFPLQLVGHHYKQRTHSTYGNSSWLKEAAPQTLWINPLDAAPRGISHGELVQVYNRIGRTEVRAKVTPRIMPGVLSLPQGAWYAPDKNGVDKNGCINMLTSQRPSPLAKGNPQHTNLVEVEKV